MISAKRRMVVTLGRALAAPSANANSARNRKTATGSPMGEPVKRRSRPVTRLTPQTSTNAASAASRKVGLKPMRIGKVANGNNVATRITKTSPQRGLRRAR